MPVHVVKTPQRTYEARVERGALKRVADYLSASAGKVFVVTTEDVWNYHGAAVQQALSARTYSVLFFPGGEERKRLSSVEALADQMVCDGGDRSSIVVAFGGGIVNDLGGFLAAIFMRGVPVLQIPTTLLAQVDAAIGGKTGANLESGKNLVGSFHQPLAVLIDPDVLSTLSDREYRAGLYEVLKAGIIRSPELFRIMADRADDVLGRKPDVVNQIISESVRIKAEVVSADEKEGDLRRILNYGHTVGHALEAETAYARFLHGEAVAFGMKAATILSHLTGDLSDADRDEILRAIDRYGAIPPVTGITAESLAARLRSDKKTIQGKVHFVLATGIGRVRIASGIDEQLVLQAIRSALA
ncbi:MAG: 3-dehydroquinate synthase [Bryobacteraceae bacterium]